MADEPTFYLMSERDQRAWRLPQAEERSIGRRPPGDILFADDITLSRRQLVLRTDGDAVEVFDTAGVSASYLEGSPLERGRRLKSGARLQVGAQRLLLYRVRVAESADLSAPHTGRAWELHPAEHEIIHGFRQW